MDFKSRLEKAKAFSDIFDIVKDVVQDALGLEQPGIMVGVSDLGEFPNGFVGAFYTPHSNMIVINKRPVANLLQRNPQIYKYYIFHVLLHEYLHAVGILDEIQTKQMAYEISDAYFNGHVVTELAANISQFMNSLASSGNKYIEPEDISIEFVKGIDKRNINYIN